MSLPGLVGSNAKRAKDGKDVNDVKDVMRFEILRRLSGLRTNSADCRKETEIKNSDRNRFLALSRRS
jgi:hypothetical protein